MASRRDSNLSSAIDLLTVEIERRDDPRLRKARGLVLDVAFPQPSRIARIKAWLTRLAAEPEPLPEPSLDDDLATFLIEQRAAQALNRSHAK